jgi:hypothetical protein
LIFDQNGNAVQGADGSRCLKCSIQPVGFFERTRVDGLNGIQARPGLVVGGDAFEVELDQFPARRSPRSDRCVDIVDCGL